MRTAKTLIRLADAQADLSLRWAHSHFVAFVMSWLICVMLMALDITGSSKNGVEQLVNARMSSSTPGNESYTC